MNRAIAALFLLLLPAMAARAQVMPTPVPPPASPIPAPVPVAPLSPVLTNPGLALQPFAPRAASPSGPSISPLDQQQTQSYRNDLNSRQRELDRQGVSPGSSQYRDIQQQLNQLNGGR
jgi:hypothetical protein